MGALAQANVVFNSDPSHEKSPVVNRPHPATKKELAVQVQRLQARKKAGRKPLPAVELDDTDQTDFTSKQAKYRAVTSVKQSLKRAAQGSQLKAESVLASVTKHVVGADNRLDISKRVAEQHP